MRLLKINPKKIVRDRGTQMRLSISDAVVREYADDMLAGAKFPPPVVFYDGTDYILADGFQRVLAAILAGIRKIEVDVEMGDVREAILHAVGANAKHGVRRTNMEKENSVMTLLKDEEWSTWSNVRIAKQCGVADTFVGDLKRSHLGPTEVNEVKYVNVHGQVGIMNVSGMARPKVIEVPATQDEIDGSDAMHATHPAFTTREPADNPPEWFPLKDDEEDEEFDEPEPDSAPGRNEESEPDVIDELRDEVISLLRRIDRGEVGEQEASHLLGRMRGTP